MQMRLALQFLCMCSRLSFLALSSNWNPSQKFAVQLDWIKYVATQPFKMQVAVSTILIFVISSSDGRVVWTVCLLSCRLEFDSESGQTNDFKIGIHSFPAWRSALKGQCKEQAGKFTCCAVGKGT